MSSARFRRRSIAAAATTLSLIVAGGLTAGPAGAYASPKGSASGTCASSNVTATVNTVPAPDSCTFSFVNNDNSAADPAPVTFSADNGASASGDTVTRNGKATASVTFPACGSTPGTSNYTVTGATAPATAQVFVSVTCGKAVTSVSSGTCTDTHTTQFGSYEVYNCGFTTNAAQGTAVSFSLSDTSKAFSFGGSSSVDGGAFSTPVYVASGAHGISVTGTVASTSSADGASGTDRVNS